ncbi:MAG: RND transporter [Pseudomonadota bacterium]
MKWLDKIPLGTLLIPAVLLGLAPFTPEPHLVEKLRMLSQGVLHKPIDIFDLLLHGTPAMLVVLKLSRMGLVKAAEKEGGE